MDTLFMIEKYSPKKKLGCSEQIHRWIVFK